MISPNTWPVAADMFSAGVKVPACGELVSVTELPDNCGDELSADELRAQARDKNGKAQPAAGPSGKIWKSTMRCHWNGGTCTQATSMASTISLGCSMMITLVLVRLGVCGKRACKEGRPVKRSCRSRETVSGKSTDRL